MDKNQNKNLYLKPDEAIFLSMAVVAQIDLLKETSSNQRINWTPETRKQLKEMIATGTSLKIKLQKLGINMSELPPYLPGDENEFLTKES